jgi:tRNA nucleotidyltransferase (CCA-adding enzyme)
MTKQRLGHERKRGAGAHEDKKKESKRQPSLPLENSIEEYRDLLRSDAARWEHFPHDADIGIRGFGRDLEEAFEQAAAAMMAATVEPGTVEAREVVDVSCTAPDNEVLLTDWLNALVFEMATRKMLFARFEVAIEAGVLKGRAWGEPLDDRKHKPIVELKGATFTALRVAREPDGVWVAQCVVDV